MAEYVAEIVSDVRATHSRRQRRFHVANLAPQFVPDLRHLRGFIARLDVDFNEGKPGPGKGLQVVELFHLLQGELDAISDLELYLFRARAGIGRDNDRGLDGEFRVLELAETEERRDTRGKHQKYGKVGDGPLFDGDGGKVHRSTVPFPGGS